MALTEIFQNGLEKAYSVFGVAAVFSPLSGDDKSLTVILDELEQWEPGGEIQWAGTQRVISYMRKDIDRRVKRNETFTIEGVVYTVQSMASYPESWSQFEGKAMVVES